LDSLSLSFDQRVREKESLELTNTLFPIMTLEAGKEREKAVQGVELEEGLDLEPLRSFSRTSLFRVY
jgi:hypothetical protein